MLTVADSYFGLAGSPQCGLGDGSCLVAKGRSIQGWTYALASVHATQ